MQMDRQRNNNGDDHIRIYSEAREHGNRVRIIMRREIAIF